MLYYVLCFTRPRYQVNVYRTIGPLVIDLSQEGRELHDYRQYMLHESAPSFNGRSDKPEVIFDSVFLTVLSCILFLIDCSVQQKGVG